MKLSKHIKLATLPVLTSILLVGCGDSSIVAKVNDEKITKSEFHKQLETQYGVEVLDAMITSKIVGLEAKKEKVNVSKSEIDKEFETYAEQYGGVEELRKLIKEYNMTEEDLKENVKERLLLLKVMEKQLNIKEDDIKSYFKENKEGYDQKEQVKASHILVEDEKTAKEVVEKLKKGENFSKLAQEYSKDDSNKDDGGDLGYFGKDEMVEPFEKKVFSMKVGEISEPVKTEYGYHIIKLEDKKEHKEVKYDEVKEQVKKDLLEEKLESEFNTWFSNKKDEYKIENKFVQQVK